MKMYRMISNREYQILHLIALEYSTPEIAQELFISVHTVISHRRQLLRKLHARNAAGLIRRAFETQLLEIQYNNSN